MESRSVAPDDPGAGVAGAVEMASKKPHAVRDAALYTATAVALAEAFAFALPESAQPFHRAGFLLVLAAMVTSAWRGGLKGGLVAGGLGLVGIVHLFLTFGGPLGPVPVRAVVGGTIGAFGLGLAGLIGHLRDRERRALEKEHAVAAALREANRSLTEANRALEEFTYVVTHDLKEPVRAVDATLRASIEDYDADERVPEGLRALMRQAREANTRLDHTMRSLLDLGRASRIDPRDLSMVRLTDTLGSEECRMHYAARAAERGADVRIEVPDDLAVVGDREAVCQLFGNLIGNAVRHSGRERPTVRARVARSDGNAVEVVVEDDGEGFPPAVATAFERGELPRARRGSGFGLTIARRAAQAMGGTMWLARSRELGGAAVHVRLGLDPRAARSGPASRGSRTTS